MAQSYGEQIRELAASGQTALGPALLVATGMITEAAPGATIVLCTDGCSNVGVGGLVHAAQGTAGLQSLLPGLEACRKFYRDGALRAREHGATVSVISIEGEHSNLQALGVVADVTGGTIQRTQPHQLASAFELCVFQLVVAVHLKVHLRLHTRYGWLLRAARGCKHDLFGGHGPDWRIPRRLQLYHLGRRVAANCGATW